MSDLGGKEFAPKPPLKNVPGGLGRKIVAAAIVAASLASPGGSTPDKSIVPAPGKTLASPRIIFERKSPDIPQVLGENVTETTSQPLPELVAPNEQKSITVKEKTVELPQEAPPQPSETKEEYTYFWASGLIKVAVNREGLPVNFTLPDGKIVTFDKEMMQNLRNEAITNNESVIIKDIPLPKDTDADYRNHPPASELPKDILTSEELTKKGINIIQSSTTYLQIRREAFDPGGPFEIPANSEQKLTIVLVDGPAVLQNFMEDPKYEKVKNLTSVIPPSFISGFRSKKIEELKDELSVLRKNPKSNPNHENDLLDLKLKLYRYLYSADQKIAQEMAFTTRSKGTDTLGLYVPINDYERDSNFQPTSSKPIRQSVIFLAVGAVSQAESFLYFDSAGKVSDRLSGDQFFNWISQPKFTYPDPQDLQINPHVNQTNPYLVIPKLDQLEFTALHELGHRKQNSGIRKHTEADADLFALEEITKAQNQRKRGNYQLGKGDNYGYYFIFNSPPSKDKMHS